MNTELSFTDSVEVASGVFCIPTDYPQVADAPLWVYLVRDRNRVSAMIDCGVPTTYDAVLADALPGLGIDPTEIEWLILTHGHTDHMGGHASLRRHTSFSVAAPLEDVIWIQAVERQWHDFWDCWPGVFSLEADRDAIVGMCGGDLPVDHILRDGEVFEVGDRRLEVVQTRGHTRGHCAFFERETGITFTGDSIQGHGISASSGTSVFAPLYDDADDYVRGLERLRALPFTLLCPAHQAPLGREAGLAFIDDSIRFVGDADELVRNLIQGAQGPLTAVEVAAELGRFVGTNPPVSIQTVYAATAHLRQAARAGLVEPLWAPTGRST
jgi:glyoxylase-like metal-dependent hydrolase (beta-lactamase superfamily II)